jgi:predicted aspartyl protease
MTSRLFLIGGAVCLIGLSLFVYLLLKPARPFENALWDANSAPREIPPEKERAALFGRIGYVEVPLQPTNEGELNVVVQVNGEPWLFFLDTGATDTMVDKPVPKRYKLATSPSGRLMNAIGGKTEELPKIVMESFTLGGLQQKLDGVVTDMSGQHRSRIEKNDPLPDGLLGANYLCPFAAVIDYGSSRLFLWPPAPMQSSGEKPQNRPAGDELAALLKAQEYQEVPLLLCKNKLICVDVQVQNERVRLLVDTGAMASCIDPTAVDRLHLPAEASGIRVQGATGRDEIGRKASIPVISIGSVQTPFEAFVVNLSSQNAEMQKQGDAGYDGILGGPILRHYAAVIDYGSAKMYLCEPKER